MRYLVVIVFLCSTAVAAEHAITWSSYTKQLHLTSFDPATSQAEFQGRVTLTGLLFLEFDMASPTQANGEVNFAKFVPDAASVALLPAVTNGFYTSPIRYVRLEPAEVALLGAVGKVEANRLSHGASPDVTVPVEVTLTTFNVGIQCDSRVYWAPIAVKQVRPHQAMLASVANRVHGC